MESITRRSLAWPFRIFRRRFALWLARQRGVHIHHTCVIGSMAKFQCGVRNGRPGSIEIGKFCELQHAPVFFAYGGSIVLGDHVFCGPFSVVYGHGGVQIGEGTLISMHCRILSSEHTVPSHLSSIRSQPDVLKATTVGRDVWLGAGVTILGGVVVGDGCIVGAGAVVTKDLPPGSIAYGVPARIISYRNGS